MTAPAPGPSSTQANVSFLVGGDSVLPWDDVKEV